MLGLIKAQGLRLRAYGLSRRPPRTRAVGPELLDP